MCLLNVVNYTSDFRVMICFFHACLTNYIIIYTVSSVHIKLVYILVILFFGWIIISGSPFKNKYTWNKKSFSLFIRNSCIKEIELLHEYSNMNFAHWSDSWKYVMPFPSFALSSQFRVYISINSFSAPRKDTYFQVAFQKLIFLK